MESNVFKLHTERLGPLPLINHFLDRLGLFPVLDRFVPTTDLRCRIAYARRLGVLLRSILTEREPIYRLGEVVNTFAPEGFGLSGEEAARLTDDAIGRALDRLFDADRGSLLTEIVLAAAEEFDLVLDELHNDSTTVKFTGRYARVSGRSIRGKKVPFITYGFSKDHRSDLSRAPVNGVEPSFLENSENPGSWYARQDSLRLTSFAQDKLTIPIFDRKSESMVQGSPSRKGAPNPN